MAYKERINPKTGRKEYKVRYYFKADGKKKDSETAWFESLEHAEREAKKLKELKEKADRDKTTQRRDKKLISAYEEFIEYLKIVSDKDETNTDKKEWQTARAIYNNHMPLVIQDTKIKDLSVNTFKTWLDSINKKRKFGWWIC